MNQRILFGLLALAIVLLLTSITGCVEIPSSGPAVPDYRSTLRIVHQVNKTDTISLLQSTLVRPDTPDTLLEVVSGSPTDTVRTVYDSTITHIDYNRAYCDFPAGFEVVVDGASRGTLAYGQTSAYFDLPSGSRKFLLRGTAQLVDAVAVRDTVASITVDTLKPGRSTKKVVVVYPSKNTYFSPLTGTVATVVDSPLSLISMGTEIKGSMVLMWDTTVSQISADNNRGGVIRYGRIRYRYTADRQLFAPSGVVDTTLVRFVHNSYSLRNTRLDVQRLGRDAQVVGLTYTNVSTYVPVPAPLDTAYVFAFVRTGTSSPLDTVLISTSLSKRITVVWSDQVGAPGYVKWIYKDE